MAAIDLSKQLDSLGASIDRSNKRLDLTRKALKELIDNDFAYLQLLAAIDAEVAAPTELAEHLAADLDKRENHAV